MPFELWREVLLNDADLELARSSYARLSPEPYQPWIDKLDLKQFYCCPFLKVTSTVQKIMSSLKANSGVGIRECLTAWGYLLVQMPGSHEVCFNPVGLAEKIIVAGRD